MKPRKLRWMCFVTGKEDGFPCAVNLTEQLQEKEGVAINHKLDEALMELEDLILEEEVRMGARGEVTINDALHFSNAT